MNPPIVPRGVARPSGSTGSAAADPVAAGTPGICAATGEARTTTASITCAHADRRPDGFVGFRGMVLPRGAFQKPGYRIGFANVPVMLNAGTGAGKPASPKDSRITRLVSKYTCQ